MIFTITPQEKFNKQEYAFWEDFLSSEEINLLLAQPEWCSASPARIGDSFHNDINFDIRRSDVSWLQKKPELIPIYDKFASIIGEINNRFFGFDINGLYEYPQLTIYTEKENGYYDWHIDMNQSSIPRKLSMSLLLSDPSEFEGGDLQIKTGNDTPINLEQKKGRAWFFPSYCLHRVTPITKGMRRSLVLWIGGPAFR